MNIILLSSLLLSSTFAHATTSSETNVYIAALAQLLEQKTIGDAELVTILEAAEDGKVVNPISPIRAETSVEHYTANNAVEDLLLGEIDVAKVAAWAKANIKEQDRIRKKRKQTQEDTKDAWKEKPTVLSASRGFSCGITAAATIKCWGNYSTGANSCHLASDGTVTCSGYSSWPLSPAPFGAFESVSAGQLHACGLKVDGSVECWGDNKDGQSDAPPGVFRSVSAGSGHTCGVKIDGAVKCWGNNAFGQSAAPTGFFRTISAGNQNTCGVKMDGTIVCWGGTLMGHLTNRLMSPSGTFKSVSTAESRACGVKVDDTIECWGYNNYGQSNTPTGFFKSISTAESHTCGIRVDDTVECWTSNDHVKLDAPSGAFEAVSAGWLHTCGMRLNGVVECWGDNSLGQASPPYSLRYPRLAYFDLSWFAELFAGHRK